jgi:hypothetical protein
MIESHEQKHIYLHIILPESKKSSFCPSPDRSKKAVTDTEVADLTTTEKNKAIEDGQNNNVDPAAYISG